jgi:hypothetical protein
MVARVERRAARERDQRLAEHEHEPRRQPATPPATPAAALITLQQSSGNRAVAAAVQGSGPVLARHPLERILKHTARWLSKRAINTISRHIAMHARRIGGKAVHSVFRSPKKIKRLVQSTVEEATAVVARHARTPADQAIEEGALKIHREVVSRGKYQWVIQREFPQPIGTKGERILRIIVEQSGRVVNAFPAERLKAIGLTAGGTALLSARTAEAASHVRDEAEAEARLAEERESRIDWVEFVPLVGDIYGGALNEGEDEQLASDRHVKALIDDIIAEVEHEERRTLAPQARAEIEELVRAGIAAPYLADEEEEGR